MSNLPLLHELDRQDRLVHDWQWFSYEGCIIPACEPFVFWLIIIEVCTKTYEGLICAQEHSCGWQVNVVPAQFAGVAQIVGVGHLLVIQRVFFWLTLCHVQFMQSLAKFVQYFGGR